jgi:stearoyl-CoA 9-desaturase NADPH oxidoreductase
MPERGARPRVPRVQRTALKAVRAFSTPLLPDDYLELINPLWSTRELRGRVEGVEPETEQSTTVTIRPGYEWPGHDPGQYVRIGFDIEGVRHWRAYSLTSDSDREDGFISITPKLVEDGMVSPYVNRKLRPGTIVTLSDVEGQFVLPDPLPERMLFISAGSGVTPIMSMLRSLERRVALTDAIHLHSAKDADDVMFGDQLRGMAQRNDGLYLHEQHTGEMGRLTPEDLDDLCSDWRDRETFLSGPGEMIDAMVAHWEAHGDSERLWLERFQKKIGGGDSEGEGGTVRFLASEAEADPEPGTPILVAGEEIGLELPYGCREGICHTCVGELCSGRLRDLRSDEIYGQEGQMIRTCLSAPEGPVEINL